jgi:hypothetical protein
MGERKTCMSSKGVRQRRFKGACVSNAHVGTNGWKLDVHVEQGFNTQWISTAAGVKALWGRPHNVLTECRRTCRRAIQVRALVRMYDFCSRPASSLVK